MNDDNRAVRLRLHGVSKSYGETLAIDRVDLDVADRELLVLLGPSGCGKTTLLRLIAGLETVDNGSIELGGATVSGSGVHEFPERRRIGLVFQNGALFPHLSA